MPKNVFSDKGDAKSPEGQKTRRAALRTLVGASALAVPTIGANAAAPADPIFSAIERHKAACNARDGTRFVMDDLFNTLEREVSQAEWDAYERAHDNEDAAFDELLTKVPTTAAGMRAAIAHFISLDDRRLSEKMRRFLATLLKSPLFAA